MPAGHEGGPGGKRASKGLCGSGETERERETFLARSMRIIIETFFWTDGRDMEYSIVLQSRELICMTRTPGVRGFG